MAEFFWTSVIAWGLAWFLASIFSSAKDSHSVMQVAVLWLVFTFPFIGWLLFAP